MSTTEKLRHQRRLRRLEISILVGGVLLGALDALAGLFLLVALAAGVVAVMIFSLRLNILTVRNIEHANRPRPDYSAIAAMERPIWGEAFEHEGAPKAESGSVAELHAMMDDLADRATEQWRHEPARRRFPGERTCPRDHSYFPSLHDDRCYQCEEQDHYARYPESTQPATLDQYIAWLRGYVGRGGKITHTYDYPFSRRGFRYASSPLTIDSDYEFGARSRSIIVAAGVTTERTDPGGAFGGWGHTNLYFMHGYRTNDPAFVPVYSDPEFGAFRRDKSGRTR